MDEEDRPSPNERDLPPEAKADAAPPDRDRAVAELLRAQEEGRDLEGRVIGWNRGGFHVVIAGLTAFCPRSEMELGRAGDAAGYVDRTLRFRPIEVREAGRRIVVSRAAVLRAEQEQRTARIAARIRPGAVLPGRIRSLADFGAFVDLGEGVEGLVHVSEISRHRVEHPAQAFRRGQEVTVQVLKVEAEGARISLSTKALEPEPWDGIESRYPEGAVVTGRVERTTPSGAFVELEPGVVGLLAAAEMGLAPDSSPSRAFPPGREVSVQVLAVNRRRRRISLAPEGARLGGSHRDYKDYLRQQEKRAGGDEGFNALAAAFRKAERRPR